MHEPLCPAVLGSSALQGAKGGVCSYVGNCVMRSHCVSHCAWPAAHAENDMMKQAVVPEIEGLPELKPEDMQFFSKLLQVRGTEAPCWCWGQGRNQKPTS